MSVLVQARKWNLLGLSPKPICERARSRFQVADCVVRVARDIFCAVCRRPELWIVWGQWIVPHFWLAEHLSSGSSNTRDEGETSCSSEEGHEVGCWSIVVIRAEKQLRVPSAFETEFAASSQPKPSKFILSLSLYGVALSLCNPNSLVSIMGWHWHQDRVKAGETLTASLPAMQLGHHIPIRLPSLRSPASTSPPALTVTQRSALILLKASCFFFDRRLSWPILCVTQGTTPLCA